MCSCGGALVECICGDWCCVFCPCFNRGDGCTEECLDDCTADHRGEL